MRILIMGGTAFVGRHIAPIIGPTLTIEVEGSTQSFA